MSCCAYSAAASAWRPARYRSGARHGDKGAPIFRHGGIYKGPKPRSHAHDLTKKFRRLGLMHALSAKAKAGELVILDEARVAGVKTRALAKQLGNLGWKRALVIDATVDEGFARAARNIDTLHVLPAMGANVYDILRRDTLVVTRAGVEALVARINGTASNGAANTEEDRDGYLVVEI